MGWIGVAETVADRGKHVAERLGADFLTTDFRELLRQPEVTAAVIATDEHLHVEPILAAVECGVSLMIEKPLATELAESARVLAAIERAKVDAVVGYTQRFRRRFLVAKEKVWTGQLGDVTLVTSRAFMNRLVALDNYKRTDRPETISPMVISGTHTLDVVMWLIEAKGPVEAYARSIDRVLGPTVKGIDATAGLITMSDGSLYHLNIPWALPVVWPGSVDSLEIGIVGTEGVLTIDDTIVTWCSPPRSASRPATRRTPHATWTSWRAICRATSRSASRGARCARRPTRGSSASPSTCRPHTRPPPGPTTGSCPPRPSTSPRAAAGRSRFRSRRRTSAPELQGPRRTSRMVSPPTNGASRTRRPAGICRSWRSQFSWLTTTTGRSGLAT